MSWVDKELKRRSAAAEGRAVSGLTRPGDSQTRVDLVQIKALWNRLEAANNALPSALRLQLMTEKPQSYVAEGPQFLQRLVAQNGASLGLSDEGIRYVWPEIGRRKSNNFWIRWRDDQGYIVSRRVGRPVEGAALAEVRRFDESSVDHILKCLVTGVRLTSRSISKRRFWIF